uniref:Arginine-containing cyclodipeptide synthase eshA n=1 Tax=Penicillium shearii TaxID=904690 RepID=ESHA_PENSH|nr:EshA [Penicillium shearii]
MSIPTDIANLLIGEDAKLSIHFDKIPLHNDAHHSGSKFYMLSTNRALRDHEEKEDDLKYLSKGRQGAIRLNQLLNAPHLIKERESTAQNEGKAVMRLGETAMVIDETFDAQPIHSHIWNSFMSIEFRFPQADFTSLQYLQTSWKGLESGDTLYTKEGTPTFEEVSIVSGVCLFNARLLEMSTTCPKSGGVDVDLLKSSTPTYNELDYIARASSAIADVAAMNILRACEQDSGQRLTIKLDIPSWHYFHTVATKFVSKQCSNTEVLQWMDAVDQRHDQIGQTFVEAIRYGLEQRGIHDSTSYGIGMTSRTNTAAILIRTAIEHEEVPSLDAILAALDSEEDGCWKRFYEMIPVKERPSNLDQLGYLYYVYEAIRPSLAERPAPVPLESDQTKKANLSKKALKKRKPRRLIISVDDSAERRIYSRAQRVLSKIRQCSEKPETYLVESYVCRRFLVNGNEDRARLGRLDPLPDIPVRTGFHHEPMLPLDVVRQLYGNKSALNLQRWLQEAGLSV